MSSAQQYVNIAAYKFVTLDDLETLRPQYQALCNELALKGTVLLTPEGINMFLSGTREHIDTYLDWVRSDARLADLTWKESLSTEQSHKRMLVKIKKEIITMRMPLIKPELGRAPAVDPVTLKRWLDQGHDDDGVDEGRAAFLGLDQRHAHGDDFFFDLDQHALVRLLDRIAFLHLEVGEAGVAAHPVQIRVDVLAHT